AGVVLMLSQYCCPGMWLAGVIAPPPGLTPMRRTRQRRRERPEVAEGRVFRVLHDGGHRGADGARGARRELPGEQRGGLRGGEAGDDQRPAPLDHGLPEGPALVRRHRQGAARDRGRPAPGLGRGPRGRYPGGGVPGARPHRACHRRAPRLRRHGAAAELSGDARTARCDERPEDHADERGQPARDGARPDGRPPCGCQGVPPPLRAPARAGVEHLPAGQLCPG
ncbi:unnamed protein product, partial [Prorocentrum cordatum]